MAGAGTLLADTAVVAYVDGQLPDALDEMAVRLDLAGAGDVLDAWIARQPAAVRQRRRWAAVWSRRWGRG